MINFFRKAIRPLRGKKLGRSRLAKKLYVFFASLFNPIEVEGRKMFINPRSDVLGILLDAEYEKEVSEVIKRVVKSGDVVVDLGAHIGFHTLLMAELVGEKGKVYAFEPDPENFSYLKKNVEVNGYQNVVLFQKAVSEKTGGGKLYVGKSRSLDRVYPFESQTGSLDVETVRLDDAIQENVDFLKMDIEGAEGLALKGMERILQNPALQMIVEMNASMEETAGVPYGEVLKQLSEFRLSLIKSEGLEGFGDASAFFEKQKGLEGGVNVFCSRV